MAALAIGATPTSENRLQATGYRLQQTRATNAREDPALRLEPGAWSLEPGAWSLKLGAWSLKPEAWSQTPEARSPKPASPDRDLACVEGTARRKGLGPAAAGRAASAVVDEARRAQLDPLLVAAVIDVESSFRTDAVSPAGAVGLMQLMPATAAWLAPRLGLPGDREDLLDPERNVRLGVRYLAGLVEDFGGLDRALLAYNVGPGRARALLAGGEPSRAMEGYPARVLRAWERLRRRVAAGEPDAAAQACG